MFHRLQLENRLGREGNFPLVGGYANQCQLVTVTFSHFNYSNSLFGRKNLAHYLAFFVHELCVIIELFTVETNCKVS